MKKRTEITIETERVVVMESTGERPEGETRWCEKCGAESRLIGADAAGALLGVSPHTILRWAEAAGLHFAESEDGSALLCLRSLAARGPHAEAVEMKTVNGEHFNA
jgi:hypothetical protein